MTITLSAALTAMLVLATVLPFSRSARWWVRDLDFPRLQIGLFGLLLLALQLWRLDISGFEQAAMLFATLGCVLYQGWWIFPYTRLHPFEVKTATPREGTGRIRILAANVLESNRNADTLIALVRRHDPDIVVTVETNEWWQERLDVLEDAYPYAIKCPLENLYGMLVYSSLPLEDGETRFLVEPDVPSMHATVVLASGQRADIHFLHPAPPSPTENDASTERDAELLIVGRHVCDRGDFPVIVAGDLNDVAWSATTRLFRKTSGLLDPRVGRGMFNTFHAGHWFMRWPLDHLFHSRHFTLVSMERLPGFGSDHFPVFVDLVLEPAAQARQEGLEADEEDEAEADTKIAEARDGAEKPGQPGGASLSHKSDSHNYRR